MGFLLSSSNCLEFHDSRIILLNGFTERKFKIGKDPCVNEDVGMYICWTYPFVGNVLVLYNKYVFG